jgi:glycine/D-amino acid oxidase-like deaminating enzyme
VQFPDPLDVAIALRTLEACARFADRPGGEIDLRRVGYLFRLDRAEDLAVFERSVALQNELGVPSRLVTPEKAATLSPLAGLGGVIAAAFCPLDGHASPEAVVHGYAALLFHREGPGLLFGMTDRAQPGGLDVPTEPNWLSRMLEVAGWRAPAPVLVLVDAGVAGGWTGYYEVSPDHNALVGESVSPKRFLYATGFSGHGFLQGRRSEGSCATSSSGESRPSTSPR